MPYPSSSSMFRWTQPSSVYEVSECILNAVALSFATRPWDYSAINIYRALHSTRFLAGVSMNASTQLQLMKKVSQSLLNESKTRGVTDRPPLTLADCQDHIKQMVAQVSV